MRTAKGLGMLALFGLGVLPLQAGEFVAVNLFDEPDSLHAWDTTDSLGTDHALGITLAANYVRGLVLTGPATGWYTSVFRDPGTPDLTGLYRLENGVSTFVGPLPYRTPEAWGLVFSADKQFLYWIADQDWTSTAVPYRLYRVDFNGQFTLIGPLSVPGTTNPEIRGLALGPADGQLYAYDQRLDVLVRINPLNAAVTVIGALGINLGTAGALAFSADGSELILCFGDGHVAHVNPTTGHINEIGRLPYIASALCALPRPVRGDLNCDGVVDFFDIDAFTLALLDSATYANAYPGCDPLNGDMNDDGTLDFFDIDLFTACALAGGC